MPLGDSPPADRPLLVGTILTFESASALEAAAADVDELGGVTTDVVGAAPTAREIEVQFALGELVHDATHRARVLRMSGDQVGLGFSMRTEAATALRALAKDSARPPAPAKAATALAPPPAAPAAAADEPGVVLLIGDTLTFDSAAAVASFIQEVQGDGGVLVDSLGADAPESGQVAIGLSLAGRNARAKHDALAMNSGDDQIGLMFADPAALIADLQHLVGGPAEAAPAAASARAPKAAPGPAGPKGPQLSMDELGLDFSADDALAAALESVGDDDDELNLVSSPARPAASARPAAKAPAKAAAPEPEAASDVDEPAPLAEEANAIMAGAIVNPTTPEDFLVFRMATPVDPRQKSRLSLLELMVGLNTLRTSGTLVVVCGRQRLEVPFLDGTFFGSDDELYAISMQVMEDVGRWALLENPTQIVTVGRMKREPRPLSYTTLRKFLGMYDRPTLRAGLDPLKDKYPAFMINTNYTRLGITLAQKEKLFLSPVGANGKRSLGSLIEGSQLDENDAVCFLYICVVYELVQLLDKPKA